MSLLRFALPPSLGPERLVEQTRVLREMLSDLLATAVDVTVSQSYESLARNLLSGAVDAAHAPPFVCAQVEPRGVTIAARVVRQGRGTYGAAFVRKRGADTTLMRPKPIRAAWVDARSVAGYLLPVAHLKKMRRIDPDRHFADQRFYGSYPAAVAAVLEGRADLCATHVHRDAPQTALISLEQHAPGRTEELEVIELTNEVPGDGIAVRNPADAEGVRAAFLHLHTEPAWRPLLDAVFVAERFEPSPPRAYRVLYAVAPADL